MEGGSESDTEMRLNDGNMILQNENGRPQPAETMMRSMFESLLSEDSSDDGSVPGCSIGYEQNHPPQPDSKTDATDRTSGSDNEEIILSMMWQTGHLGAAYYNIATSELFVLDDVVDVNSEFNMTKTLYRQCLPGHVVTMSGVSGLFLDAVNKLIADEPENHDEATPAHDRFATEKMKLMTKKDNDFKSCIGRVQHLKLDDEPLNATREERRTFLSSVLNFNCRLMIHALGLLLKYLDGNWNALALDATGHPRFIQLHNVTLRDIVMIGDETYNALQIVHLKQHPSLFKFGTNASNREGISLFSVLNHCQSRAGALHLWKMLWNPTRDLSIINERQDIIQFFLNPKNRDIMHNLISCIGKVHKPPTRTLNKLTASQAKASDWRRLHETICNVIYIVDICSTCRDEAPLFAKMADCITDELHNLRYFLEYIVDFEACKQQNKFVVKPGVDPALDRLNNQRQELPSTMTIMAQRELENLPQSVQNCVMVYLPNIGFLLTIPELTGTAQSDDDLPNLEFKFVTNDVRYYKSPGAIELDNTIGDVFLNITIRQSEIMLKLVQYISNNVRPVFVAINYIAEIDALISLARTAQDCNFVRPEMSESRIMAIKGGRHVLQELSGTVVPNDTFSRPEGSLIKIIFGPNGSGKSIYLKQIVLIVFMAHIGSYVPADSATIGICTHILCRIQTRSSIASNTSSFLDDLRQMTNALNNSTANSLVVIDEFGTGTAEIDGTALLAACITDFINRGTNCPHVFLSTHLHRVMILIPKSPLVERQTFEFITNTDKSLVFLYKITNSNATSSFALSVARLAGLDSKVVDRAEEVFEGIKQGKLPAPHANYRRGQLAVILCDHLKNKKKEDLDLEQLKSWIAIVMGESETGQSTDTASTS